MGRPLLLVMGLVVVLGAVLVTVLLDDAPAGEAAPATVEGPASETAPAGELPTGTAFQGGADARPLEVAPDPSPPPAEPDAAAEAPTTARVSGRLTFLDGEPAADLELRVGLLGMARERSPTTTSDADGRYALEVPAPSELVGLHVGAGPASPSQRHRRKQALEPGEEAVFDLELARGGALAGQVFDLDGRPVAGAVVEGWTLSLYQMRQATPESAERRTTTNGDGRFELQALGPSFVLAARGVELASHDRVHGQVDEGGRLDGLQLRVSAARTISGRVEDELGRPVADAALTFRSTTTAGQQRLTEHEDVFRDGAPAREARSGPDGRFQVADLCQRQYTVLATHADFAEWTGDHGPEDGELVVVLSAGATLTGTVVSASDGRALPGARVHLGSRAAFHTQTNDVYAEADEEGRFHLAGLTADDEGWVSAQAEGHAVNVLSPVVITDGELTDVVVSLGPERPLAGVVVDVDGAPVADAVVTAESDVEVPLREGTVSPRPTWEREFGAGRTRTDEQGRFAFHNLHEALYRLAATDPVSEVVAHGEASTGREDVRLVIDPDATVGVTLAGVARDAATGRPLQTTFFVTPMLQSGPGFSGTSSSFHDEAGAYHITGLEAGTYLLNANADGYAPWSGGVLELEEGEHRYDIDFLAVRNVTFRVVDGYGNPMQIDLRFVDEGGAELMIESGPGTRSSAVRTAPDGTALAKGLPAARLTVVAQGGLLTPRREFPVDLRTEPRGPVELVYEHDALRTLAVIALQGTPSEPPPPPGTVTWQVARWITAQVTGGHLRPPPEPCTLTAHDSDGGLLRSETIDPAAGPDPLLPVDGVSQDFVGRLELPATPVTLSLTCGSRSPVTRSWDPASDTSGYLILLIPPDG